jgi:hypothetical protein
MVKVSITLPNNAQITLESEEPEVIHEIVGMVLRDLPRELMQSVVLVNGNSEYQGESANGKLPTAVAMKTAVELSPKQLSSKEKQIVGVERGPNLSPKKVKTTKESTATPLLAKTPVSIKATREAQASFTEFCRSTDPVGDMRKVVVAAEGALRFLDVESVDADGLANLFALAGWSRPHSFVQSLRNAARSKFRWLERVPGRAGYYTVTEVGRATALCG